VLRLLPIAGFVVASLGLTGCAGGWETVTSHRFRDGMLEHPLETTKSLWVLEDPMLVLRTDPPRDGDERASAIHRLKEPIRNKGTQEDQDIIVNVLAKTATSDPSPVLRMEAIGALGRFEDPRVAGILIVAYKSAHGRRGFEPPPTPKSKPDVVTAGLSAGRSPTSLSGRTADAIKSPVDYQGFQPEWVTAIRCRAADSLCRTSRPEAATFLAAIAGGAGRDTAPEGSEDRDIRLAAVRGLGLCRQPEAVIALTQVLNQATGVSLNLQDTAIIGRTHEGLVWLTGKKLPPDPQQWNEVVQAGVVIAPEPGWWENTIVQMSGWVK
jgi:hypothetical protein